MENISEEVLRDYDHRFKNMSEETRKAIYDLLVLQPELTIYKEEVKENENGRTT